MKKQKINILQYVPNDTISQFICMKIEKQPEIFPAEPKIGKQLGFMDGEYGFNRFEFDNYRIFNRKVDPKPALQGAFFILHRKILSAVQT